MPALYQGSIANEENMKEYFSFPDPEDKPEEKAFNFLKRFIDEASHKLLELLLRFVTGYSVVLPGIRILVSSRNMTELEARPISQTCIKTLVIPRNVQTFHAFEEKLTYYLHKKDLWVMED